MCQAAAALQIGLAGTTWLCNQNIPNTDVCTWLGVTCSGSSVAAIELAAKNLVGTIPSSLGGLSSLAYMSLVYNNLVGPIPSTLCSITKLTTLYLYSNKFTCYPSCISSVLDNDLGSLIQAPCP